MWIFSLISFLLLGGFLLLSAMRFGVSDMVSDTYYQLRNTTGSEVLGGKVKRNFGWVFSVVMVLVAFLMMVAILDLGKGVQCLAFIGCAGLAFVGCAPNYFDKDEYLVHKCAAIIAAIGCIGWCLSVCWWLTLIVLACYLIYLAIVDVAKRANNMWHISNVAPKNHPWYWAEAAGFLDVFLTYWVVY